MKKIFFGLFLMWVCLVSLNSAEAQVSIGIGLPNVSIGINLPLYPQLTPVPGYPVYYAPQLDANYFFYDGMYWVYQNDNWYASAWYNGPWGFVEPNYVPLFVLRVPVRYYRQPPVYFHGWQSNAPPRWGQHWGHGWEQNHHGWNKWNRGSAPAPAPLPAYQRQYSGDRYPRQLEQQQTLRNQHYRYQPREKVVRQHFKQQGVAPAQRVKQEAPPGRGPGKQEPQHNTTQHQKSAPGPRSQQQQQAAPPQQHGPSSQEHRPQQGGAQREQQGPGKQGQEQKSQDRGDSQEPNRGHGQGQNKNEDRGQGRNN